MRAAAAVGRLLYQHPVPIHLSPQAEQSAVLGRQVSVDGVLRADKVRPVRRSKPVGLLV